MDRNMENEMEVCIMGGICIYKLVGCQKCRSFLGTQSFWCRIAMGTSIRDHTSDN